MSSWKKAGKSNQKVHRERHQPAARKHFGLLEKKKDYQLRAKDKNEKTETLKLLGKRALNRNPDEFYHHMVNSQMIDDVSIQMNILSLLFSFYNNILILLQEHHENEQEDEHSPEQIQLMQTQDVKYITMKKTIEANKIQKMQSELHMIDEANKIKNTHTFFTDSGDEDTEIDLAKRLNTHPSMLHRRTNRPRLDVLNKISISDADIEVNRSKQFVAL